MQRALQGLQRFRHEAGRNGDVAALGRAIDRSRQLGAEHRVALALRRPEHLLDRGVEDLHARGHRRAAVERADGVVEQERRRRPQADQRRHARVAAAAGRHLVGHRLAGERVVQRHRADRGQLLVRLRREVVPDVAGERVGRQRAAGVGAQQRHRDARVAGEIVVVQEVGRLDDLAHLRLELVGLRPLPVGLEAVEVARALARRRIGRRRRRRLARMAARAGVGEDVLAALQGRRVGVQVLVAAGRVFQAVGLRRFQEEERRVRRSRFGRLPVARVLLRVGDLDRRDRPCRRPPG